MQFLHEVHGLVDALLDPALDVPLLPVCQVAPGVAGAGASVVLAWGREYSAWQTMLEGRKIHTDKRIGRIETSYLQT